jgi:hypothetical protein
MTRRMFGSGGPGYQMGFSSPVMDWDQWQLYKKENRYANAKVVAEDWKKFTEALGRVPQKNDPESLTFWIEYNKGKHWWQIAEEILGHEIETRKQPETVDPKRGTGPHERLKEYYGRKDLPKRSVNSSTTKRRDKRK